MPIRVSDDICEYNIKSLGELRDIVLTHKPSHWCGGWFYRGQAIESWTLIPKSGRSPYNNQKQNHRFAMWCREAKAYTKNLPKNYWERLAIAQHHGLATNLLDWTGNPLAAAYFACNEHHDQNGAIFCYYPTHYVTEPDRSPVDDYNDVVAYQPNAINQRIINQQGYFTYHPDPMTPIIKGTLPEPLEGPRLKIIYIDKKAKREIMNELNLYGINQKTLFPDLDGLSAHYNLITLF